MLGPAAGRAALRDEDLYDDEYDDTYDDLDAGDAAGAGAGDGTDASDAATFDVVSPGASDGEHA